MIEIISFNIYLAQYSIIYWSNSKKKVYNFIETFYFNFKKRFNAIIRFIYDFRKIFETQVGIIRCLSMQVDIFSLTQLSSVQLLPTGCPRYDEGIGIH